MDRRQFLTVSAGGGLLALMQMSGITGCSGRSTAGDTAAGLSPLPYRLNALNPHISKKTLDFHYNQHHAGYVANMIKLIAKTPYEKMELADIIRASAMKSDEKAIFNNAAQAFNHDFYWKSMRSGGGGKPSGKILEKIESAFGSYKEFRSAFAKAANTQFGSGWAWLVEDAAGNLQVLQTANADTPLTLGLKPLVTIDVWEHAYYLDYQNRRAEYVDTFLDHLINWEFALANLS